MMGDDSVSDTLSRLAYPDKVLLALPLLFVGVYVITEPILEANLVALGLAGVLCSILVCDALFVRPPTSE